MSADLYHAALIASAREAFGKGRLADPAASASRDNPICGDRVTIDIGGAGGPDMRIAAIGHEVKGCLLCEAAAATLARIGRQARPAELRAAIAAIEDLLQSGREPPPALAALGIFLPVHRARSRRDCVRLPFLALATALDHYEAQEKT